MSGSLAGFLCSELSSLSAECKRKNPEIKQAIDEILPILNNIKSNSPQDPNLIQKIAHEIDIVSILKRANESANGNKYLAQVISILHRLLSHVAIPGDEQHIGIVLKILETTVGSSEDTQLRALQCIMPLLTHFECRNSNLLLAYRTCIKMQSSKFPTVQNAAMAVIRQLIILLFDKVQEENSSVAEKVKKDNDQVIILPPHASDAFIILQDICRVVNDENALVLPLSNANKNFTLELVESILTYHFGVFLKYPDFSLLIKEKILSPIFNQIAVGRDFSLTCRAWRLSFCLLKKFHRILPAEIVKLLVLTTKALDESNNNWERALALETFKELFSDYSLISSLEGIEPMKDSKIIEDLIIVINNVLLGIVVRIAQQALTADQLEQSKSSLKVPLLQQFEKSSPPTVTDAQILWLAMDVDSALLNGINRMFIPASDSHSRNASKGSLSSVSPMPPLPPATAELYIASAKTLIETLWGTILKSITSILTSCKLDFELRKSVLSVICCLVKIQAHLNIPKAMDSTMQSLVEMALPEYQQASGKSPAASWGSLLVNDLNLTTSLAILKLALDIPELLNENWIHVLRIVHGNDQFNILKVKRAPSSADAQITKKKNNDRSPPSETYDLLGEITDYGRKIMEMSKDLSSKSFLHFLKALCELSNEVSSVGMNDLESNNLRMTIILFPAQKLKQVALINVNRFISTDEESSLAWEILIDQLTKITTSNEIGLRGVGCETMSLFMTQFASSVDNENFKNSSVLQHRALKPLEDLLKGNSWIDINKMVLESLNRLLQHVGPFICHGWSCVFRILLSSLSNEETNVNIIRSAFTAIKLICAEYLTNLDCDNIRQVIEILTKFSRSKEDLNISLTSVGIMWDIADYVRKENDPEHYNLWVSILSQYVNLSTDSRPEVRNSAIQSMFRTVEIGGSFLTEFQWVSIMDDIMIPLLDQVPAHARTIPTSSPITNGANSLTHHSRDTNEKQWNETQVLVVEGTANILLKYFNLLIRSDKFEDEYWKKFMSILSGYCFEGNSVELVDVAISTLLKLAGEIRTSQKSYPIWVISWQYWCEMATNDSPTGMGNSSAVSFTQDSLIKFVKIFNFLHNHLKGEGSELLPKDWLQISFSVFDKALKCPTPQDQIRDVDSMTELQRNIFEIICNLDYNDELAAHRSLFLGHISGWLDWLDEIESIVITDHSFLQRIRLSSHSSHNPISVNPGSGNTFIALSIAVLGRLESCIKEWAQDKSIYPDTLITILSTISRLMKLKYRCPTGNNPISTWKLATKAAINILSYTLPNAKDFSEYWGLVVELVERTLEINRTMIPKELSLDQLEVDEEFDIGTLLFVRDKLLPMMDGIEPSLIERTLKSIESNSRLYYVPNELSVHEVKPSNLISDVIPVVKERFAITCLQSLFLICSKPPENLDIPRRSNDINKLDTFDTFPIPIIRVCLPILLNRCKGILHNYVEIKSIMGKMPFPRVRQDEMLYVLQKLNDLRLPSDLLVNSTDSETRRRLLETAHGHLFYLYPQYCECLQVVDQELMGLVRRAFEIMGNEAGLIAL